jgi:hypothetical protein
LILSLGEAIMSHLRFAARLIVAGALAALIPAAAQGQEALRTIEYDIRDLVQKPETVGFFGSRWNAFAERARGRNLEPAQKAALVVQAIYAHVGLSGAKPVSGGPESIEVVNGSRLVIRASAAKHAEIDSLLKAFRRLGDVTVIVRADLFEVDDVFYTKLKNAKPVDWEEQERIVLGLAKGNPSGSLLALLRKQKPVLSSDEVKGDDGLVVSLLSLHKAVSFRVRPEQAIKGDTARQTVLEGVAFVAGMRVSPDRRYVRVQLTEKATHVSDVKKVKVLVDAQGKEADAQIPFVNETAHIREFEVRDGGSILLPVQSRPRLLQDTDRWWVLQLTPRIRIEDEERWIRMDMLQSITPLLVEDVLKNPRLKTTREFYGTPGDKRFALVDSAAWNWPKDLKIEAAGFERTPAKRAGQRLLGIRLDGSEPEILVTLLNAGGSANGAALGGCTLRYRAREMEKGYAIELAEPLEP